VHLVDLVLPEGLVQLVPAEPQDSLERLEHLEDRAFKARLAIWEPQVSQMACSVLLCIFTALHRHTLARSTTLPTTKSRKISLFLQRLPSLAPGSPLHCWHPSIFGCRIADPQMWNCLPPEVTSAPSLAAFRTQLKTFPFTESYLTFNLSDIFASTHCP